MEIMESFRRKPYMDFDGFSVKDDQITHFPYFNFIPKASMGTFKTGVTFTMLFKVLLSVEHLKTVILSRTVGIIVWRLS